MDKTAIPISPEEYNVIDMSDGVVIKINDTLHTLNSTAYEILELCDGQHSIQIIMDEMKTRYPDEDIETITEDFIKQLADSGLIEI